MVNKLYLAIFLYLLTLPAQSAIVTWSYTGVLENVDSAFSSDFSVGDTFSGEFTYDTSLSTISGLNPTLYIDGIVSGSVTISGNTLNYDLSENDAVMVYDSITYDYLSEQSSPVSNEWDFSKIILMFFDDNMFNNPDPWSVNYEAHLFDGELLPESPIDFSLFSTAVMTLHIPGTDVSPLGGRLDSLEMSVASVPLPAAVWLFISGLIGFAGVVRHKKHSSEIK